MCSMVRHMMGMELVEFPSATIGREVHCMVIACMPGSKCETWMFLLQTRSL